MSIWDSVVDYPRYQLAIMWSGGMDSTIAYFYAQEEMDYDPDDIVLVYVDYGHPYKRKETKAIFSLYRRKEFKSRLYYVPARIVNPAYGNIPTPEKQVIPGRNLMLAYIGSVFADRVWLMALDGEMHEYMRDKSREFFRRVSDMLSYVMDRDIVVETPFGELSKTQILRWFVVQFGKEYAEDILKNTVTCYDPSEWACGKCSTCFKRWVAYENVGLDWKSYFKNPPYKSDAALELLKKYHEAIEKGDFSHYSKKRILETVQALKRVKKEGW